MRLSQACHIRFRRSAPSSLVVETLAAAAEDEEVVVGTVAAGVVEEATNRVEATNSSSLAIRVPGTRTFRLETGQDVVTIIDSGKVHIFVPNPPPAPGRISTLQDRINEPVTSSARPNRLFKILYILTQEHTCRKYTHYVKMKSNLSLKQVHFKLNGVMMYQNLAA